MGSPPHQRSRVRKTKSLRRTRSLSILGNPSDDSTPIHSQDALSDSDNKVPHAPDQRNSSSLAITTSTPPHQRKRTPAATGHPRHQTGGTTFNTHDSQCPVIEQSYYSATTETYPRSPQTEYHRPHIATLQRRTARGRPPCFSPWWPSP